MYFNTKRHFWSTKKITTATHELVVRNLIPEALSVLFVKLVASSSLALDFVQDKNTCVGHMGLQNFLFGKSFSSAIIFFVLKKS